MQIYCVKIQDIDTKQFLNQNEYFTAKGRTFATLNNAKTSVSGKLGLSRLIYRDKDFDYYKILIDYNIKKYLNCNFVIYTDEGEQYESVKDYIIYYLKRHNREDIVECFKELK